MILIWFRYQYYCCRHGVIEIIAFSVFYRYLDYDVIRMRNNDDIVEFQRALNGSYEPIQSEPQQESETAETEKRVDATEPSKRSRRSLNRAKGRAAYANRKFRKVKFTVKTS